MKKIQIGILAAILILSASCTQTSKPSQEQQTPADTKAEKVDRQVYPYYFLYPYESQVQDRTKVDRIDYKAYSYNPVGDTELDIEGSIYWNKGGDTVMVRKEKQMNPAEYLEVNILSKNGKYVTLQETTAEENINKNVTLSFSKPEDGIQKGIWLRGLEQGKLLTQYKGNNVVMFFESDDPKDKYDIHVTTNDKMYQTQTYMRLATVAILDSIHYNEDNLPVRKIETLYQNIQPMVGQLKKLPKTTRTYDAVIENEVNEHGDWIKQNHRSVETNKNVKYYTRQIHYRQ